MRSSKSGCLFFQPKGGLETGRVGGPEPGMEDRLDINRDDYLTGPRTLTRQGHPDPFIHVLDFAQRYTAAVDFTTYDGAVATLRATNAFEAPTPGVRLRMPETGLRAHE